VRVYRTDDWRLVRIFIHSAAQAAFSPDGKWLASAGNAPCYYEKGVDATIRLWDMATGRPGPVLRGFHRFVESLAWSPDGKTLLSGGDWGPDAALRLWSIDGKCLKSWAWENGGISSVAWSPDGRLIAAGGEISGSSGRALRLWQADGVQRPPLDVTELTTVHRVAWSPDGRWLAASGGHSTKPGAIVIWDTVT